MKKISILIFTLASCVISIAAEEPKQIGNSLVCKNGYIKNYLFDKSPFGGIADTAGTGFIRMLLRENSLESTTEIYTEPLPKPIHHMGISRIKWINKIPKRVYILALQDNEIFKDFKKYSALTEGLRHIAEDDIKNKSHYHSTDYSIIFSDGRLSSTSKPNLGIEYMNYGKDLITLASSQDSATKYLVGKNLLVDKTSPDLSDISTYTKTSIRSDRGFEYSGQFPIIGYETCEEKEIERRRFSIFSISKVDKFGVTSKELFFKVEIENLALSTD